MAKQATLEVRMDSELKEQVELLYKQLGTSCAEAVRIFARQSVEDQGMPFFHAIFRIIETLRCIHYFNISYFSILPQREPE